MERAWEQCPFADTTELHHVFKDEVLVTLLGEQEAFIAIYSDIAEFAADKDDEHANQDIAAFRLGEFDDKELEDLIAASAAYCEKFHRPLIVRVTNPADRKHPVSPAWKRVEASKVREARFASSEVIGIADECFIQLIADTNSIRTVWVREMDQVD